MATKKQTKTQAKQAKIAAELRESARKIWLAGLGALAAAEEEGSKLFKSLVQKGQAYEGTVREPVQKATEKVKEEITVVRDRTEKFLKKFEATLDQRVRGALQRLGVPSRSEIEALSKKVEALTKAVESLKKQKTTARKKTSARRTATRRAAQA